MMKRFHSDGRYTYGYTASGLFTLVNREGESLYAISLPLLEKVLSHFLWLLLWSCVIYFTHWVTFLTPLLFLHIACLGARLTTLCLRGAIVPLLFPPLWVRLTRRLHRGEGKALLERHGLGEHPGLLWNLALLDRNGVSD